MKRFSAPNFLVLLNLQYVVFGGGYDA